MAGLTELDVEVVKLLDKLIVARWANLKRGLPERTLSSCEGKKIDVYLTRSLKRLQGGGYVAKQSSTRKGSGYYLTPVGLMLAEKISKGIRVDDPLRDQVLVFGYSLQWIKNRAIIEAERDAVEDYFKCFKEAINKLDVETFLEDVKIYEGMMENEEDPWDDSDFVMHHGEG